MTSASEDLDQQCKHELTRRTCAFCNGTAEKFRRDNDLEVERVLALGGWFPARYNGVCASCGERYGSGVAIRRSTNEDRKSDKSRYVAMCCAPSDEEPE